jgi:hypothetical protein
MVSDVVGSGDLSRLLASLSGSLGFRSPQEGKELLPVVGVGVGTDVLVALDLPEGGFRAGLLDPYGVPEGYLLVIFGVDDE